MRMKAIETEYNGYKFRSRLEARWAYFFDLLGIEYEYEPEGIEIDEKTKYLPDFFLPHFHCFFEVKRKGLSKEEKDRAIKRISWGMHCSEWAGMICYGDPVDNEIYIYCQESDDGGGGSYEGEVTFGLHPLNSEPYLFALNDWRERDFYTGFDTFQWIPMATSEHGHYEEKTVINNLVKDCRIKARQARFEYGQTPRKEVNKWMIHSSMF